MSYYDTEFYDRICTLHLKSPICFLIRGCPFKKCFTNPFWQKPYYTVQDDFEILCNSWAYTVTSLKVKMYASTYAWPICRNAWFGFDKIALISNLLYVKQIATNCNDFALFQMCYTTLQPSLKLIYSEKGNFFDKISQFN